MEYKTNISDKHCIPTHFNAELDVSYASLHTFPKVAITNF